MKKWFLKNENQSTGRLDEQSENHFQISYSQKKWKKLTVSACSHIVIASIIFGFAFYVKQETTLIKHYSQVSIAREAELLSTLNDIASQVAMIKADHESLADMKKTLVHLEQTVATEQSLSKLATSADLQQINRQIVQLKKSFSTPKYSHSHHKLFKKQKISRITLPFQVKSIDQISDQPFASVLYHQDILPIRLNETLVGWKVIGINMAKGVMVWENPQRRRIQIIAARSIYE